MEQSDPRSSSVTSSIAQIVSRYVGLLIQDTRLSVTEKLTRLLAALTVCALIGVLALATLLFLSIAAGIALADIMNPIWAYVIVAAFYMVLAVIIFLCRKVLIVNPIARFLSRLLIEAPENTKIVHAQPTTVS